MGIFDECCPALSITFPKSVRIENSRLTILYWFLATGALAFVGFNCWVSSGYLVFAQPDGRFQYWPTSWAIDDASAAAINEAESQAEYCTDPKKYEYCFDKNCSFSSQGSRCMDICTSEVFDDCLETPERFIKETGGLFFPTFFQELEIKYEPDSDSSKPQRRTTSRTRTVKGVEDMGIEFTHEYTVNSPTQSREQGSSREEVLTILRDASGNELDRWLPGTTVTLQLKKMFEYAGVDLNKVEPELGKNFLEGAEHPEGVLTRMAGTQIFLEMSYHNPWAYSVKDWYGPVAILTITCQPSWSSNPQLQVFNANGSLRHRYYQGIRVTFTSKGRFAWVSMDQIISVMTSILVFIGVAKKIVFIFTVRCLGIVSSVYDGFLYQRVRLSRECCALAARLCSHTSTFVELKDRDLGISKARLKRRFQRVFGHAEELDAHEVDRFVEFVYGHMKKMGAADQSVDVEGFVKACSYGESLDVRTMISIFDADRRKTLLEKTFAGPVLRKLFKSDASTRARSSADLGSISIKDHTEPVCAPGSDVAGGLAVIQESSTPAQDENGLSTRLQMTVQDEVHLNNGAHVQPGSNPPDKVDKDPGPGVQTLTPIDVSGMNGSHSHRSHDNGSHSHRTNLSHDIGDAENVPILSSRLAKVEDALEDRDVALASLRASVSKLQKDHDQLNLEMGSIKDDAFSKKEKKAKKGSGYESESDTKSEIRKSKKTPNAAPATVAVAKAGAKPPGSPEDQKKENPALCCAGR